MTTPVSPSVLNPPKNGAHPSQPQQPSEPKPNTAAPAESPEAKLAAREAAIEKREKAFGAELNKFKDTNKGLGAKLSEYEQLKKEVPELRKYREESEQRKQLRKLNPIAALEEDFGKDWADKVTSLRVNGVPPVDLVASVVQQLKSEFKAELDARDAKTAEATTAAEHAQIDETRAMVAGNASRWYEQNAKDYPVFERLGDAARIGQILGQRIEAEFQRTGKLLTDKEAADLLEGDMLGIVEAAVKADKYKSKLQGGEKPANVSDASGSVSGDGRTGSTTQPGVTRRTLDNSMTASTSGRAPPRSDAEREQRAMEAFNAARNRGKA
jgi:hypothetical protein